MVHSEIDRGSEVICITHITYIFNTYTTWGSQSLTTFPSLDIVKFLARSA